MPFIADESLSRVSWASNESIHAGSTSSGSGFHSPSSSHSTSPITSPDNTLQRRRLRRSSSLNIVIKEPFVIKSDARDSRSQSPTLSYCEEEENDLFAFLTSIFGWYPCFLARFLNAIVLALLPQTWKQLILSLPRLWISVWFWLFNQIWQLPLAIFKILISFILSPNVLSSNSKRTILISGGSTIQALHLARNFYSVGARVIVCEIEGQFAISRFSTCVSKFYTVPKPTCEQHQSYVKALCEIVDRERVKYYIPVSATTPAYYDAVAKPHLELLGCTCFCPGIKEVRILDDTLEVIKKCQKYEFPVPIYYVVTSKEDVLRLYATGAIRRGIFVMSTAGPRGLREHSKIVLPLSRNDLRIPSDISEQRPWVVVQNLEGDNYVTCTTVKESKVIANVTCKLDRNNGVLVSVENQGINQWVADFFKKISFLRPVSGHISFRFVHCKDSNTIIPLSTRVGISLPYTCYTNMHPRLVWNPCRHRRQNLELENNGTPEASVSKLVGAVLDKRKALFAIWDPLPYCAYYHMQLPFKNVLGFMKRRQDAFPRPIAASVR